MDYRAEAHYRGKIDQLRRIIVRTPMWVPKVQDGQPVLVNTGTDEVLLRIEGEWAPDLQRFFEAFNQYNLLKLLALLEGVSAERSLRDANDLLDSLIKPRPKQSPGLTRRLFDQP